MSLCIPLPRSTQFDPILAHNINYLDEVSTIKLVEF
jgi:hypothetical protein